MYGYMLLAMLVTIFALKGFEGALFRVKTAIPNFKKTPLNLGL